jgi:hypothetical protein
MILRLFQLPLLLVMALQFGHSMRFISVGRLIIIINIFAIVC